MKGTCTMHEMSIRKCIFIEADIIKTYERFMKLEFDSAEGGFIDHLDKIEYNLCLKKLEYYLGKDLYKPYEKWGDKLNKLAYLYRNAREYAWRRV